jgi:hypothetical protein
MSALLVLVGLSLLAMEWFAHHTIKTSLPRQTLSRYRPDGRPHVIFLGSSLTDAGILPELMDSLTLPLCNFNLALAGLSNPLFYQLLVKNFILTQGSPKFVVVEASGFPFSLPTEKFQLEGNGERLDLLMPELMEYSDFWQACNGFPGIIPSTQFYLHKQWFTYHYRLELQGKLKERLTKHWPKSHVASNNPYKMADGAEFRFQKLAQSALATKNLMQVEKELHDPRSGLFALVELARTHHFQLIMLTPPCPPQDRVLENEIIYRKYREQFGSICDSLGVVNIDLSHAPIGRPYTFSDGIHLDSHGARIFTSAFAFYLKKVHR